MTRQTPLALLFTIACVGPEFDDVDAGVPCTAPFAPEASGLCARWTPLNPLATPRDWLTPVKLSDGRVLAVGGESRVDGRMPTSSAASDIFDPATSIWRATAPMTESRSEPTAIELPGGSLLVVGGLTKDAQGMRPIVSAEMFDPSTETWSAVGAPIESHAIGTATVLPDGRVLFVGGFASDGETQGIADASSSVEAYDPSTDDWELLAPLPEPRVGHSAALLNDGRVIVVGGNTVAFLNGPDLLPTAFVYDPDVNTWSVLPAMAQGRWQPAIIGLAADELLIVGGTLGTQPSTEQLTLNPPTWSAGPEMMSSRVGAGVVTVADSVMSFGGRTGNSQTAFISERLIDDEWSALLDLPTGNAQFRRTHAFVVGERQVLVVSTSGEPEHYSHLYEYRAPE